MLNTLVLLSARSLLVMNSVEGFVFLGISAAVIAGIFISEEIAAHRHPVIHHKK
jgi:hypothetical protein